MPEVSTARVSRWSRLVGKDVDFVCRAAPPAHAAVLTCVIRSSSNEPHDRLHMMSLRKKIDGGDRFNLVPAIEKSAQVPRQHRCIARDVRHDPGLKLDKIEDRLFFRPRPRWIQQHKVDLPGRKLAEEGSD